MSENKFKIILEYIKDLSIETPSVSTLTFVRENLSNYIMDIDISSLVLKNKALEQGHFWVLKLLALKNFFFISLYL